MYCIECGAQIPENSKFCPHCGKKQSAGEHSLKEKVAETIIVSENTKQIVEEKRSSIDYQYIKKSMGWYLAWVILHLGILLICSNAIFTDEKKTDAFWPLTLGAASKYDSYGHHGIHEYDIREFLVYTIFPLAILVIYSMVKTNEDPSKPTDKVPGFDDKN